MTPLSFSTTLSSKFLYFTNTIAIIIILQGTGFLNKNCLYTLFVIITYDLEKHFDSFGENILCLLQVFYLSITEFIFTDFIISVSPFFGGFGRSGERVGNKIPPNFRNIHHRFFHIIRAQQQFFSHFIEKRGISFKILDSQGNI